MDSFRLRIIASLALVSVSAAVLGVFSDTYLEAIPVAIVAFVLGALLSGAVLQPLSRIKEAATRIAAGDFGARVQPRPSGEIGDLTDAFNTMAETLQGQMAAAAQERRRLAAALNSSIDAVIALDSDLRVLFANVAAERLFLRPADTIVGSPFVWTLANDRVVEAVRASRDRAESQVTVIERPGRQFLQVVTTPISSGGDWSVLAVFHDLTDVKRTEQIRRDFVANVGHELRTPLSAIKSVVETLRDGAIEEPEIAREFLARAEDEVDRLVQMVQELLELSRIESGDIPLVLEPASIESLIADTVQRLRPLAERKGVELDFGVEAEIGNVNMDAGRIEHVLTNLVHNAIKFTPEGGSVRVSACIEGNDLAVRIHDTGIGIARGDLARIFERFYKVDQSRASRGSGLGLAVAKHAVEAHGGKLSAESTTGAGSTFQFTIPRKR